MFFFTGSRSEWTEGLPASEIKGKKATTLGIGIGEAVLWRRKKVGRALGKLTSLWEDGIFLGVMGKSGELILGDGKGVWKTRTVHRKPPSERWDPKTIDLVRHPPWRTCDDDPKAGRRDAHKV